jgi:trimethylamine---corrinoid protein Co-methyltransferase
MYDIKTGFATMEKTKMVQKSGELDNIDLLDRIHKDALRVLEEVGVHVESQRVRRLFEDTGMAAYDEETKHLHILSPLIEQTLSTAPKRDKYWIPEDSFGIGGTAPFVYDDTSCDLIPPTFEHLKKIATIANEADVVNFMARGVLLKGEEIKVLDTIIELCDKPVYAAVITEKGIARAKEIVDTRGKLTIQFSIINSPLNLINSMMDSFFSCVEKNIPIYVSTMPMAGLSAPYSMSGLLTLTHAEGLFGVALTQLINPGVTVVHAGLPSIANIGKNYSVDLGMVSHNIANLLQDKINRKLGLPSIQTACTTSQDHPNKKAEEDAVNGFSIMKKYGFHHMRHCFGFLRELISFSIAKLERHIDLCRETMPDEAPEFSIEPYDPEGFDCIARNSSNPNYMRDDHTLRNTGKAFKLPSFRRKPMGVKLSC